MYDKPDNEKLINKIEKAQNDAGQGITGAIRGTSREKPYANLALNLLNLGDS